MKMKKTVLSVFLIVMLVICSIPVASAASPSATVLDLANAPLRITAPGDYVIVGEYSGDETAIDVWADVNITLAYVTIHSRSTALYVGGSATINLVGINTIVSTQGSGIIGVGTINGPGTLKVTGQFAGIGSSVTINSGTIIATGEEFGIGSDNFSGITVNGGHVIANGNMGIGNWHWRGTFYNIYGGKVEASSIDTGNREGRIFISNATVIADSLTARYWGLRIEGDSLVIVKDAITFTDGSDYDPDNRLSIAFESTVICLGDIISDNFIYSPGGNVTVHLNAPISYTEDVTIRVRAQFENVLQEFTLPAGYSQFTYIRGMEYPSISLSVADTSGRIFGAIVTENYYSYFHLNHTWNSPPQTGIFLEL